MECEQSDFGERHYCLPGYEKQHDTMQHAQDRYPWAVVVLNADNGEGQKKK
jgi:hypothetical protein